MKPTLPTALHEDPKNPVIEKISPKEGDSVCCEGGGGALGHPRIWLPISGEHSTICPYCSRSWKLS